MSFDTKPLVAVPNIRCIAAAEIAFGEAEVMNGVEQVGFARAVAAANAHYSVGENKLSGVVVLELKQ